MTLLISFQSFAAKKSPLAPIKLDHARDTMQTFMEAMEDYRVGVEKQDPVLLKRINDAVRSLNLEGVVFPQKTGIEAAILLKETLDRVIKIDYAKTPADPEQKYWRLKNTEFTIRKVEKGDRQGQFLITRETVLRAREFYEKVKELPFLKGTGGGAHYQEPWLERRVPEWARTKWFFVPNWKWIGLFLSILIGLILKTVAQFIIGMLKRVTRFSKSGWDRKLVESIQKPAGLIIACSFWFSAIHLLRFDGAMQTAMVVVVEILFSVSVIWTLYNLTDVLTDYLKVLAAKTETLLDDQLVPLLSRALKIFVFIFGILVVFQNMGFNVASVFAGLGLGGLAFALAAKDTCANLFGSIMILMDRPFQIGEWINVNGQDGTVEQIGFRSTRIRTFYNSLVSIPNSVIANSLIDNYGRRKYRRVKAILSLTYSTTAEQMEAFVEGVKNIIKANAYTRKDYMHVVFNGYGECSLNVLVYCFLKVPDWSEELVQKQNLYLEILRLAEDLGVEFAFPTQTLHVDTFPGTDSGSPHKALSNDDLARSAQSFGPKGAKSKPKGMGIFTPPHTEPK